DATIGCISDQVTNFGLRVIHTVRTHLAKSGVAFAFDAESLTIRQMQVQDIHFHRGHSINVALEHVHRKVVTPDITQQSPPSKAWVVIDDDSGNIKSIRPGLDQLKKGLQAMQNAKRIWSHERCPGCAYAQLVRLILAHSPGSSTSPFYLHREGWVVLIRS